MQPIAEPSEKTQFFLAVRVLIRIMTPIVSGRLSNPNEGETYE